MANGKIMDNSRMLVKNATGKPITEGVDFRPLAIKDKVPTAAESEDPFSDLEGYASMYQEYDAIQNPSQPISMQLTPDMLAALMQVKQHTGPLLEPLAVQRQIHAPVATCSLDQTSTTTWVRSGHSPGYGTNVNTAASGARTNGYPASHFPDS